MLGWPGWKIENTPGMILFYLQKGFVYQAEKEERIEIEILPANGKCIYMAQASGSGVHDINCHICCLHEK